MINPAVSLVLIVTLFGLIDGTGEAGFCWSSCLPTDGVLLTRIEVSGSMAGEGGGFKSTTNFKRAKNDGKVTLILIGKYAIFIRNRPLSATLVTAFFLAFQYFLFQEVEAWVEGSSLAIPMVKMITYD